VAEKIAFCATHVNRVRGSCAASARESVLEFYRRGWKPRPVKSQKGECACIVRVLLIPDENNHPASRTTLTKGGATRLFFRFPQTARAPRIIEVHVVHDAAM
jgi:hypothetical protein